MINTVIIMLHTMLLIFILFIEIIFSSCGSGLSGEVLTDEGHHWVGLDISQAMLGRLSCSAQCMLI